MVGNLISINPLFAVNADELNARALVFQVIHEGCLRLENLRGTAVGRATGEVLQGAFFIVLCKIFIGLRFFAAIAFNLNMVKVGLEDSVELLVHDLTHIRSTGRAVFGSQRGYASFAVDAIALRAFSGVAHDH